MTRVTDAAVRLTADRNICNPQAALPLADSMLRFHPQHEAAETADAEGDADVLVSVVMPCLNEARALAACIEQAHAGCQSALASRNLSGDTAGSLTRADYEIIIADNGSTDGSQAIAIAHVAKVVSIEQKGYGAALMGGIAAARGKYVVMGDSDCSYDFGEVPRFLDKLEEGYDLVMGNRFAGGIMRGAMPWHHRYIGNPVLSGIGRLLYRTPCKDWHCGLRAFDRKKIQDLQLSCTGMEFASEMVVRASQRKLPMIEMPTILRPDGRDRSPHLRSFRDGWRHLVIMLGSKLREQVLRRTVFETGVVVTACSFIIFSILPVSKSSQIRRVCPPAVSLEATRAVNGKTSGSLSITNTLGVAIEELRFTPSCSCTVATIPQTKLGIEETTSIPFSVDLVGRTEAFSVVIALEYKVRGSWFGETIDVIVQ